MFSILRAMNLIAFFVTLGHVVVLATPDPGLADRAVGGVVTGMVDGVANRVVGDLTEAASHLLGVGGHGGGGLGRGGLLGHGGGGLLGHGGGMGHGEGISSNLPFKDIVMRIRNLLGIQPVHGTEYCTCPREEPYYNNYRGPPYGGGGFMDHPGGY